MNLSRRELAKMARAAVNKFFIELFVNFFSIDKPEPQHHTGKFDRGTQQQPTPQAAAGEGFERGSAMRKEVEEPPKEKTFVRLGLTPEEVNN